MSSLEGFKILVVEDDASLSRVMSSALSKKGAVVTIANNGEEGFSLVQDNRYDLVLSDVQMPVMTGLELLVKIREAHSELPVFLLVTGQAKVTEYESVSLGAAGLVQKPFKLSFLVGKLETLIETEVLVKRAA